MVLPKTWLRPDILCASLVINLLALAMPLVVLQAYDRIIPNEAMDTLTILVVGLAVAVILETMVKVIRANTLAWSGASFEHNTNVHFLKRLLFVDTLVYNQYARGYFLSKLQSVEELTRFCSGQSMIMLIDFPFAVVFLTLIWMIAGNLVWVPLGLLLIYAVISLFLARYLNQVLRARHDLEQQRQNFLIESLGFVHTVKAMALEAMMLRRYERLQARSADCVSRLSFLNSVSQGLGSSVAQLGMVLVVGLGSAEVLSGQLSLGALAAATMLTMRAIQPGIKAMSLWTSLQTVKLAKRNAESLDQLTLSAEQPVLNDPLTKAVSAFNEIRLVDVGYRYPGTENAVFDKINLTLTVGDSVAITGATGTGKTTLAMIMAGYLQPTSGEVMVDGGALTPEATQQLRSYISWAPQNGVLYEGTLLENMTLFRSGEVVTQALELSRLLGLETLINRLPEGLETRVGGAVAEPVSNAVRQLVSLIRALVGHPKLLILDDVNAVFDFRLDRHLYHYLLSIKDQKALFITSNRPSFLRLCHQVYELTGEELVDLRSASRATEEGGVTEHD